MRPNRTLQLPEAHQASVFLIPFVPQPLEELRTKLTPDEQQRANRFHFEKDAIPWALYRATLRQILGELIGLPPLDVPILYSDHGKPLLGPSAGHIHFNLSHCEKAAVLIVAIDGPVGIDIEPLDRSETLLGCESAFCHPEEIAALPLKSRRAMRLLEIWTAKEAALKAMGTGFSQAPEQFRLERSNNSDEIKQPGSPENYPFSIQKLNHDLDHECMIHIAVPKSITSINVNKIDNLL